MNYTYLAQTLQGYGDGLYGECAYVDSTMCGAVTIPGVPNTGFVAEHPALSATIVVATAVFIYAVALVVLKRVHHRKKTGRAGAS